MHQLIVGAIKVINTLFFVNHRRLKEILAFQDRCHTQKIPKELSIFSQRWK
jgi:hypothetical protein